MSRLYGTIFLFSEQIAPSPVVHARACCEDFWGCRAGEMASEISEIFYAFGPQLDAFMFVNICISIFVVIWSSLSEKIRVESKAAKYEIQKPSTCRATLFRCKFSLMFPVFNLLWSTFRATKTFVAGWRKAARWLVDLLNWFGSKMGASQRQKRAVAVVLLGLLVDEEPKNWQKTQKQGANKAVDPKERRERGIPPACKGK